jgi:ceramide glucosyltransferase
MDFGIGIGPVQLLVIFVVAFFVLGPERLPEVARTLARGVRTLRGYASEVQGQFDGEIGGLREFADVLAEDYEIGKAVREAGYEVAFAPGSIGHVCFDSGARNTLGRQLRVARTIKVIDPIGYVGTVFAHPFALALVGVALGASGAIATLAGALVCRMALWLAVRRTFRLPPQPLWLIPLHDIAAFAIYLASFARARVTWRRYKYRVANDGTLLAREARTIAPRETRGEVRARVRS